MTDFARLIEQAFPLKPASLDSVYEKNVRHGHISTLHIWPARRPLAACRAALLATLLPDPGTPEKRRELCEKIAGKVVKRVERKKMPNGQIVDRIKEDTEGGILHWGRETENSDTLEWFRQEIRKAYGGQAPKVLDPFSGGGAIPLEAMRLGCQATAVDINPVAWFILKCTLEYPQKLARQKRPLPAFILDNEEFMEAFYKANPDAVGKGKATKKQKETLFAASKATHGPEADLAWHVRAWGQWVLAEARRQLASLYPTYADFEPLQKDHLAYEHRPMTLVPLTGDGTANIDALNEGLSPDYLAVKANPRWVAKPTVAYLWARTVACKNCRARLPLLKTRWVARTAAQRIMLKMSVNPDRDGVYFDLEHDIPKSGGNNAQRREHDKAVGAGTMSKAGAKCPCCGTIMTLEDIQVQGRAGQLGAQMTAVAVRGQKLKEFRLPTDAELSCVKAAAGRVAEAFAEVPFGVPNEKIVEDAKRSTWCVQYGIDAFSKMFTDRQLVALATLVKATRAAGDAARRHGFDEDWAQALWCYLSCVVTRLCDYLNCGAQWKLDRATINHFFVRYGLPLSWDYAEGSVLGDLPGSYDICLRKIAVALDVLTRWKVQSPPPNIVRASSISVGMNAELDAVVTDPPYYNAIGYAVIMDYFYVWLRRLLHGLSPTHSEVFEAPLTPKWDREADDGELVDDASRHDGDSQKSKQVYEDGMARVFGRCHSALKPAGRLVIVFANKQPDAWETLVSSIIRAGFVVDGSWPIQTEQASRMRAQRSAALASSVWLVCKKRPATARAGWDTGVLDEMRVNIAKRLQTYWDAGIRGPDFIWAATGPGLEAYSKHPVVKKADQPGQILTVAEFLNHVRRLVVDYVVGKVLTGEQDGEAAASAGDRLDEPTAYYLLHRNDFGLDEAPIGTCILYAVSCGLSDSDLVQTWDILAKTGSDAPDEDEENEASDDDEPVEEAESTGGKVRLKTWSQRKNRAMGYEAPNGRSVPLIDRVHRLMHLWKAGDVHKVDEYLDEHGMRRHELFKRLIQSLIELARKGADREELQYLESLSNHIGARGVKADANQMKIGFQENE